MIYRIYLSSGNVCGCNGRPCQHSTSLTRKRYDAAMLAAERLAYDVIASNGGLDTLQGHTTMARVRAIDPRRGGEVDVYGRRLYVTPSVSGG